MAKNSFTVEQVAGILTAVKASQFNIRDKEGRKKTYENTLDDIKKGEKVATVTANGGIEFI